MSKIIFSVFCLLVLETARGHFNSWDRDFEEVTIIEARNSSRNNADLYRLPENVVPLRYDVFIDLYFSERIEKPYSYEGREYIIIQAKEEDVRQVVLHANVDSINQISLLDDTGAPVRLDPNRPFEIEQQYHFLKINLAESLTLDGTYTLFIDYSGSMNEGPMMRGIWRGWYTDDAGIERVYATTHFQPYNARQAFPCWDEPLFKAVFKIHLSRPTSYSGVYTNTKLDSSIELANNRVQDNFLETPSMSSYLVTFLVSESFIPIAVNTEHDPPIRIIARSNTVGYGEHALDLAVKMTEYFDEYFGIPYSTLHPNLNNDHISSPDWASAGTENWGMVSYRELYLIIDPTVTIMSNEHYAATLVSHEMAHKWFGNLITCYWWSNTWINEGYASYFGYMATTEMFPQYELHEHFNSRYLQTSLAFDSGAGTVPMNHDVNTPAEVTGHFGTISYSKGAAFLRMTSNIITLDTFRKSCRYFLENNRFEATDQYDLLEAFKEALEEDGTIANYLNFDFDEYYRIWVNEPGYPILNVNVNHNTGQMVLSQERFFLNSGSESNQIFPIPITYSTQRAPNFDELRPPHIMTTREWTIGKAAGEEWVIFNNLQQGHYRVNYDETTWGLITNALMTNLNQIHRLNRAQIVDDVFALMRSNRMTYDFGLNILRFLVNEVNMHVWDPAISGFTWLRNRLRHIPAEQAEFDEFILGLMQHAITTLGIDPANNETPTVNMARQSILQFACTLGHEECIQNTWQKFVQWRDDNVSVNSRIRRNVYMTAMREGTTTDFEFLLARFYESNFANDQLEMLRGMGASKNPESLTRFLSLTLSKYVRTHDKLNTFNYALLGNRENAKTVLEFVKRNINAIREAYIENSPARPVHNALSNLATYLDEEELRDYEVWLRNEQSHIPQYATAMSAIISARQNMNWGTENAADIMEAVRDGAPAIMISTSMLIATALISMFL